MALETFRSQTRRLEEFGQDIADIGKRLRLWKKDQEAVKRLLAIPGAGLLTATAMVATAGDMKSFRSGRELVSFLGLVPRQGGTGGHQQAGRYLSALPADPWSASGGELPGQEPESVD
jgi:transposase